MSDPQRNAKDLVEINRRHWDEVVPAHVASDMYRVEQFLAGEDKLKPVELAELDDVRGKTMLHLQCHFGMDTLSWARHHGAVVTGIDFSEQAIAAARSLAAQADVEARFIVSELYDLPNKLNERFDIVFTSYGALCWLPDLARWAQIAAGFVRPGGTLYIVEFHPFAEIFDDAADANELRIRYPYFPAGEPVLVEEDGTYADRSASIENRSKYVFLHPISEVVTAIADAGLRIEFVHEFPFTTDAFNALYEQVEPKRAVLRSHASSVPLLYSLKATRSADAAGT
jgi:SAM-dependent methyltransferase